MEELDLRMNPVKSLDQMASMPALKWVSFACNQLTEIAHLPVLPRAEYLSLFGNYLGGWDSSETALLALKAVFHERCPSLKHLFLMGNGFEVLPSYIPILKELGLTNLDGSVFL